MCVRENGKKRLRPVANTEKRGVEGPGKVREWPGFREGKEGNAFPDSRWASLLFPCRYKNKKLVIKGVLKVFSLFPSS